MTRVLRGRRGLAGAGVLLIALVAAFFVLILAEDDPPALAEEELPSGCAPGVPYLKCTYTSSTRLSFDSMVSQLEAAGHQVDASTPVWVQAWGGRGAKGAVSNGTAGSFGGYAGYAMTVSSVGALTGKQLYLYVGASGSYHSNYSGQGGASSIVSTDAISELGDFPGGLRVIAGGSGGGGRSCNGFSSGRGGNGGVSIGSQSYTAGQSGEGPQAGAGGDQGSGGAGGDKYAEDGGNQVGGYGGAGSQGSTTGWVDVSAVDPDAAEWNAGTGGGARGGGGGGGYGGGGGGGGCVGVANGLKNGGGGGGSSWARGNELSDSDAPTTSKQADGVQSKIVLTFNLGS